MDSNDARFMHRVLFYSFFGYNYEPPTIQTRCTASQMAFQSTASIDYYNCVKWMKI